MSHDRSSSAAPLVRATVLGAVVAAAAICLAPARAEPRPDDDEGAPPAGLERFIDGDPADAKGRPRGPRLILGGGGRDVDAAMASLLEAAAGGDVVVLRTSGGDGYHDYLLGMKPAPDSVETLLPTTRELADDPWVAARVRAAEGIFLAGGDQSTYIEAWRETALHRALVEAWRRGAAVGGTSAGCAVLGELAFTARHGTVRPAEALADPFAKRVVIEAGLLPWAKPKRREPPILGALAGVITDTHFDRRERLGRLAAFVARIQAEGKHAEPLGLGVDEATALIIDRDGVGRVEGRGAVIALEPDGPAKTCRPGEPLDGASFTATRLTRGDEIDLPRRRFEKAARTATVQVRGGALHPREPFQD